MSRQPRRPLRAEATVDDPSARRRRAHAWAPPPRRQVRRALEGLAGRFPPQSRTWNDGPWRTLVGTILSQRTRDEATGKATRQLFAHFPDVISLAAASPQRIEALIRPVGFYRTKAKTLIAVAQVVQERFDGEVPSTMEELLSLPGVGRKTANCVLCYGFGAEALAVDTHVHRIANRIGWVRTTTPEETEQALLELVPRDWWMLTNDLLVNFGQQICKPVGWRCAECPIYDECRFDGRKPRDPIAVE